MGLGPLRKTIGEDEVARIWSKNYAADITDGVACPICRQPMHEVHVDMPKGALTLDACQRCSFAWFNSGQTALLPSLKPPPHVLGEIDRSKMTPEQIETLAMIEAQRIAEAERRANPEPYEDWKSIPGYLGLPVELDEEETPVCRG